MVQADIFDQPRDAAPKQEEPKLMNPRMPRTHHGLDPFLMLSTMQKAIRRQMPGLGMQCAVELFATSKGFAKMVFNRLEVISHEDIDVLRAPHVVPFVATACRQADEWYDTAKPGKSRMAMGNAIRMMCDAPKCRIGDDFHIVYGLANLLEDQVPVIPDFALDKHTQEGRRMGRGLDHFAKEGVVLVPPAIDENVYAEESLRLQKLKAERGRK